MVSEAGTKRHRQDGYRRKHDRNKFRRTTNATIRRKDLGNGLKGFLLSCTPHHENQCFRDGVLLLGKFCDEGIDPDTKSSDHKQQSLQDELNDLRSGEGKLFTRVDGGVTGAVFLKINNDKIDIEHVVEAALRDARQTRNPGSRHCIRVLPIYTTCYAKAEDAAKAAMSVAKEHFPKIEDAPISYAIAFRSRVNNSAKRDDFIPAVAAAVEKIEPRYKVNLTKPDVVLLVEVLKTSCCIGVFRHYYELAKMNLREAACPSKPRELKGNEVSAEDDKPSVTADAANVGIGHGSKTGVDGTSKLTGAEIQASDGSDTKSEEKTNQPALKEMLPHKGKSVEAEEVEASAKNSANDQANGEPKEPGQGECTTNSQRGSADARAQKASEITKVAEEEGHKAERKW